ncbi:PRTRC system protein E [Paraburkholderia sp. SARCC-3016]|uniref:PRTRC system protein E n=1 Tax=Paraburkholderia sp. SARCC-3016 TaxID=3058611 RepID=UPI0028094EC9|nr:PRTRC system protein E [Paraburkholderia sp. SARCC-3016]MDQ7980340.1 PRTRC system protein E [Paraburkholderia sp. SARCC-3016]
MFQILEPMVRAIGKLSLSLKMDGERMVVVVVPRGDSKEAVLRQPLVLNGLPVELDEGFAAAVQSFSAAHRSLDEQVAATTAILQAAEKSQAGKAQKALTKGGKKATPASSGESEEDDDDDDATGPAAVDAGSTDASPAASEAAGAAPAAGGNTGTDLLSLL